MVSAAPTFTLMPRSGSMPTQESSLEGAGLPMVATDSFPGLMPHGEHFEDAHDDMSEIREEEEFMLMDDSQQLQPMAAGFPAWPAGVAGSLVGDSGIATLSRPGSGGGTPAGSPRRLVAGVDGKFLKSVLDASTKLIGSTGQRTRELQKHLEMLGGENPVMKHFEMVGTTKMRAGGTGFQLKLTLISCSI